MPSITHKEKEPMGRKLYRVPLDFDWPINKIWKGYENPHYKERSDCSACDGSGYGPEAKRFADQWYGNAAFDPVEYGSDPLPIDHPEIQARATRNVESAPKYYSAYLAVSEEAAILAEAHRLHSLWKNQWCHHLIQADVDALVDADRLWDFTRVPLNEEQKANCHQNGWTKEPNGYRPTAKEVNDWSLGGFGHDASNRWICIKARCKRAGIESYCPVCDGSGEKWTSPEAEKAAEEWKPTEPPVGDGFQLWETTSEGSPQSPVFATLNELCEYAAENCSTFGTSNFVSAEKWEEMLDDNFVYHKEGNNIFL
jgi:hypothetical protein